MTIIFYCPPVKDPFWISQEFGENPQDYVKFGLIAHNGRDYAVVSGTKLYAVASGKVERAYAESGGYGTHVKLIHDGFATIYGHMSVLYVKVGDIVKAGDIIGLSGNTGNSSGPHLHFEVRPLPQADNGWGGAVDPRQYLNAISNDPAPDYGETPVVVPSITGLFQVETLNTMKIRKVPSTYNNKELSMANPGTPFQVYDITGSDVWVKIGKNPDKWLCYKNTGGSYCKILPISTS